MKDMMFIFCACSTLFVMGCTKSATRSQPPPTAPTSLQDSLQGTWTITAHMVINLPDGLPNDTTTPSHTETFIFSNDTLWTDTWFTASLNTTTTPPSFSVTQATEFRDTATFITGKGYIVATILGHLDTMYVNQVTSTNLVIQQNLSAFGWDELTLFSK